MVFLSFYRIVKFGLQNFQRNFWLSLVTVFILVLTLFSISLVSTLNLVAENAVASVKERVDIDFFFDPSVSEDKIIATRAFLESLSETRDVQYISKEEALGRFKKEHEGDPMIQESLEELEENPFPAGLIVRAREIEDYPKIMEAFKNSEFSDLVEDPKFEDRRVIIDRLSAIGDRVVQVGVAVNAIFIIIAVLVVFNTIRMNIYSQREEVGIKRLVGATNGFIRMPFIIESILYAVLGSIITILAFYPLLSAAAPYVNTFFEGYDFEMFQYFTRNFWKIFGFQTLVAIIICTVSSMIAVGRYLKV